MKIQKYFYQKKKLLKFFKKNNIILKSLISGFFADLIVNSIFMPFEFIKQKIQIDSEKNIVLAFKNIYKKNGFRGFYRGLSCVLITEIPHSMIELPIYEKMKYFYLEKTNKNKNVKIFQKRKFLTKSESIISGLLGSIIASLLTNPLDVVQTNFITQKKNSYKNFSDCAIKIYLDNGFRAFYRGVVPRTFYFGSVSIIFFTLYEEMRKLTLNNLDF